MENKALGVRKGTWTKEEDILLKQCIEKYGEGKWHLVPPRAGLNRCRKSCRLRWLNYLRPDIKRGCFTKDEVDLIIRLHKLLGNKWSLIAGRLPGRTANDVKNFWNTHIEKKLAAIGEQTKEDVQKINITTESKIIKPRHWTFSKLHITSPNETKQVDNNFPNIVSSTNANPCTTSSSKEESNEYMKWWSELLEATENEESGNGIFPNQNNQNAGESSSAFPDVENYATPSSNNHLFSIFDWENVSLDDK